MKNNHIYILNIETSGDLCAVGIGDAEKILCKEELYVPNIHSEKLAELTELCFEQFEFDRSKIGAVAFSLGPGSFTGLRIGLSLAKGFAFAAGIPILGIPTMRIMALTFSEMVKQNKRLATLIDARRNEFYWSIFDWENGRMVEKMPPAINSLEQIIQKSEAINDFVLLQTAGSSPNFSDSGIDDLITKVYPGIDQLHLEAVREFKAERFFPIDEVEPLYLRAFAGII